ncbi:MAG: hypothetical protein IKZ82_12060 [Clostridia bacterium]|nr:hypothetical protein [Clostridia bacterium]
MDVVYWLDFVHCLKVLNADFDSEKWSIEVIEDNLEPSMITIKNNSTRFLIDIE